MKGVLKLLSVTYCDVKLARKPADEDMLQIGNKELIKILTVFGYIQGSYNFAPLNRTHGPSF